MYISVWSGHPHFLLVSFFSTLSLMLFVLIWVVLNCPSLFYFNYACCFFPPPFYYWCLSIPHVPIQSALFCTVISACIGRHPKAWPIFGFEVPSQFSFLSWTNGKKIFIVCSAKWGTYLIRLWFLVWVYESFGTSGTE